jgi:hypothetical protein
MRVRENKNITREIAFVQMLGGMVNMLNETISLVQKVLCAMGSKRYVQNR